jgi:hypothetical protein
LKKSQIFQKFSEKKSRPGHFSGKNTNPLDKETDSPFISVAKRTRQSGIRTGRNGKKPYRLSAVLWFLREIHRQKVHTGEEKLFLKTGTPFPGPAGAVSGKGERGEPGPRRGNFT